MCTPNRSEEKEDEQRRTNIYTYIYVDDVSDLNNANDASRMTTIHKRLREEREDDQQDAET